MDKVDRETSRAQPLNRSQIEEALHTAAEQYSDDYARSSNVGVEGVHVCTLREERETGAQHVV